MFEDLRYSLKHNRKSVLRKAAAGFLFTLIIIVMGAFGINKTSQQGMGVGTAATVNGKSVPMARLNEAIERLRRDPRMQQYEQLGGEFGQKMMQSQALSQVVEMELVKQQADKEHITTTDDEVRDTIVQIPAFQEKGQFKREYYNNYLQQTGKTGAEFESDIRNEQALRRTVELFRAALKPTPIELDLTKSLADRKANVEFLTIPNDSLVKFETVRREQANEWLAKPENERKVKDYFDSHKKEYSQEEKVKARHILIKSVAGDKDSENTAFAKAQDIEKQLKAGANFAQLAKKFSDDPGSKEKGGDLGFFAKGSMVPEFEKVAFDAKPGEVSAPVKSQFGYHIIQVEEKKPASTKTFDDMKVEIAQSIIARDESHNAVASLEKALKTPEAANAIAKLQSANGLKWEEAGTFNLSAEEIPKVGDSDDAVRTAFTLSKEKPYADHLIHQGPNAYVLRYKAPDMAKKETPANPQENPEMVAEFQASRRSEEALRGWVDTLKKHSKIVTSAEAMGGAGGGGGGSGGSPFGDE